MIAKITAGCMLKIGPICWVGKLLITLVKLLLASVSVLFAHDSRLRYIIILSEQSQERWGQIYSGGAFSYLLKFIYSEKGSKFEENTFLILMVLQGVRTQKFMFQFALTDRNIQARFGLRVVGES